LTFPVSGDHPIWFLTAAFVNDSLKALLGAGLLRWALRGRQIRFDRVHDYWIYVAVTVVIAPAVSALGGAASWMIRGNDFWSTLREWFLGDAIANLVCTPLLLGLCLDWRRIVASKPVRYLEAGATFSGFLLAERFAYDPARNDLGLISPIDYVPVAFLLLAAIRFGPMGASGSLVIMSVISVEAAYRHGAGPINVVPLQMFLIVIGIPIMAISVLLKQQRTTEQTLLENQDRLGRLNAEQQRILAEISTLNQRLISAQEDERRRIGRELHDDLNQQVAVLGLQLSRVKRTLPNPSAREELDSVESGLTQLASAIHALSHELHPAFLERTGIGAALKAYCEELKAVNRIEVHVRCSEGLNIPSELALCLYRIAQESLRNAVKHSGAKNVWVSLHVAGDQIHLEVKDVGCGFDPKKVSGNGIGLVSMEDRCRMAGGSLSISSRIGEGTVVHCVVPLPARKRNASGHENGYAKAKSAHRG
jgi:two-component system sensor histidine kinase UhpB